MSGNNDSIILTVGYQQTFQLQAYDENNSSISGEQTINPVVSGNGIDVIYDPGASTLLIKALEAGTYTVQLGPSSYTVIVKAPTVSKIGLVAGLVTKS